MSPKAAHWTWALTLALLALLAACSQLSQLDARTAADLLEFIDLKKRLLRSVRLEVLRLAVSSPDLSREQLDGRLKQLVRRQAPKLFRRIGSGDGLQTYKEALLQRVIEGSVFGLGRAQGPLLTPLVAGTRLYRLESQSSLP